MKRIGKIRVIRDEDGDTDSYATRQTVVLTAAETKRLWKASRRRISYYRRRYTIRRVTLFTEELIANGLVRAPGCRCHHCLMDYDCCGRMVPRGPVITRTGRTTFTVEQLFHRNC